MICFCRTKVPEKFDENNVNELNEETLEMTNSDNNNKNYINQH